MLPRPDLSFGGRTRADAEWGCIEVATADADDLLGGPAADKLARCAQWVFGVPG